MRELRRLDHDEPELVWHSAGRTEGSCESLYSDGSHDPACAPETSQHYYGVYASLDTIPPGASFGAIVSILYPGTYGYSYYPCRVHEYGDFALDYLVR